MNKAICIFNTYNDEPDGWLNIPGVIGDIDKMTKMLEEHYEVVTMTNQDAIDICVARILVRWKDLDINRLHFHFSGHGINNQTVEIHRNEFDEIDSPTPTGECLVGKNGDSDLCSVLDIQNLLTLLNPERITITLDCCRVLDRERKRASLHPK